LTYAFSPNGFDDERKRKAAECEERWETATDLAAFLSVGCTVAGAPVGLPLLVLAGLGRVLKHSFTRIKNDPPRHDYFASAFVSPTALDPTSIFVVPGTQPQTRQLFISLLVGIDRAAAHLDATVVSVERAMGAFADDAVAAGELKLAEAHFHAANAQLASAAMASTARDLGRIEVESYRDSARAHANENPDATIAELLPPAAYEAYLRVDLDQGILYQPLRLYRRPREARLRALEVAVFSTVDFAKSLLQDSPITVRDVHGYTQ
jgi:hypothetical protein